MLNSFTVGIFKLFALSIFLVVIDLQFDISSTGFNSVFTAFHLVNFSFFAVGFDVCIGVQCYKNAVHVIVRKGCELPFLKGVKNCVEVFARKLSFTP